MKSVTKFLSGFAIGSLVGSMLALLFAPTSGEALRGQIQTEVERIQTEVKQAATDRRSELEAQLSALREKGGPGQV